MDFLRIYIWSTKMSRNKAQSNIKTLLFTPPFYWEFRINPLIY
jgi:hypothetical protein